MNDAFFENLELFTCKSWNVLSSLAMIVKQTFFRHIPTHKKLKFLMLYLMLSVGKLCKTHSFIEYNKTCMLPNNKGYQSLMRFWYLSPKSCKTMMRCNKAWMYLLTWLLAQQWVQFSLAMSMHGLASFQRPTNLKILWDFGVRYLTKKWLN